MSDVDLLKEYFGLPQDPKLKAKSSLILLMLAMGGYKKVGDFGIAGVQIYQNRSGKYLHIRLW